MLASFENSSGASTPISYLARSRCLHCETAKKESYTLHIKMRSMVQARSRAGSVTKRCRQSSRRWTFKDKSTRSRATQLHQQGTSMLVQIRRFGTCSRLQEKRENRSPWTARRGSRRTRRATITRWSVGGSWSPYLMRRTRVQAIMARSTSDLRIMKLRCRRRFKSIPPSSQASKTTRQSRGNCIGSTSESIMIRLLHLRGHIWTLLGPLQHLSRPVLLKTSSSASLAPTSPISSAPLTVDPNTGPKTTAPPPASTTLDSNCRTSPRTTPPPSCAPSSSSTISKTTQRSRPSPASAAPSTTTRARR